MEQARVKVVYRSAKERYVLRWKDPETGAWKQQTTEATRRKEAEKIAAQLEADLQAGRYESPATLTWDDFRLKFEAEKLPSLAIGTGATYRASLNQVERLLRPKLLADLDAAAVSRMQAKMREQGLRDTSIATYLRHIRAALSWAHDLGILSKMPKVSMPKRARRQRKMRGRPVTTEEFERMLAACEVVRPKDFADWQHLLEGLWFSGLRLGESQKLSWEVGSPIEVDLAGRYPCLRISAEAEKGFRDRQLPVTPDFAAWLEQTPVEQRSGFVFRVTSTIRRLEGISKTVSAIGKQARVVVNHEQGKFASAHDLRRAYGTRWAAKVQPATLRVLMRHESIETTMAFYVEQRCDHIAAELWATKGTQLGAMARQGATQ